MKPLAALLFLFAPFGSFAQIQRLIPDSIHIPAPPLDPGQIFLARPAQQLGEAVVTAHKITIRQEIDRVSYDVQSDPESKSNDALEMLRKVPMVTVDGNGNIQLKGSPNFIIFINGKPSALMTGSPADVLQAMPAATIRKIEVITVPPAKYDAEGVIGIINIITLKNTEEGYNTTLFGRYNTVFGERGSFTLNAKEGDFGLNVLLGAAHQPLRSNTAGSQLNDADPGSELSQQGASSRKADIRNGQAQLSFTPDSLDQFNASFDFFHRDYTLGNFRNTAFFSPPASLTQSYQLNDDGTGTIGALDAGLTWQHGFRRHKKETLTLGWQYAATSNIQDNTVTATDRFDYTGNDYTQHNDARSGQHSLQLDYTLPVRSLNIEAGAKTTFTTNYSNFTEAGIDALTGQSAPDTLLNDRFTYHQDIYAAYNSYQLQKKDWTFKTGLRLEYTTISSGFEEASDPLKTTYGNLIPAVSVQRGLPGLGSLTFGFTDRIQRPVLQQLNPFADRSDPGFITAGNPALRPVVNHIIELSFNHAGHTPFNITLNYAYAGNTIQQVTLLLSDTVSESTWSNVGTTRSTGINLSGNYPLTPRLSFTLNAQFSRLRITGDYNSGYYRNDGNLGNFNLFARYGFDHGLTVNVNLGYQSGNVLLQGHTTGWSYSTFNIIKEILKKKASVSLTVYDPLKAYNYGYSYTNTPAFFQSAYTRYYYRQFRFAVNYKFGRLKTASASSDKQLIE